jgi:hypothetical protein
MNALSVLITLPMFGRFFGGLSGSCAAQRLKERGYFQHFFWRIVLVQSVVIALVAAF